MQATQDWKRVTRFSQLTAGDTVRFVNLLRLQGHYRWEGHGFAVVHVASGFPGTPRDFIVRLKEIEVLSKPARKAKEVTHG